MGDNLGLIMKEVYLFGGVGPVAEELEVYKENIRAIYHHHPLEFTRGVDS